MQVHEVRGAILFVYRHHWAAGRSTQLLTMGVRFGAANSGTRDGAPLQIAATSANWRSVSGCQSRPVRIIGVGLVRYKLSA
jgi:hypothetical protein